MRIISRLNRPVLRVLDLLALLAIPILISGNAGALSPNAAKTQRVLVLFSDERLLPANVIVDEAMHATFAASGSERYELHSEFLDVARFPGEAQQQRQRDFFREKYRERPPDVVIAVGGDAFAFMTDHRAELFAGVPIVYCSVAGDPHPESARDSMVADVPVPATAARTLETILRLQPDTTRVAIVSGSGPRDLKYADVFRQDLAAFGHRVAIAWLTNHSLEELRGELSRLPDHTVVLYLTMFQDETGAVFRPRQALDKFAPASRVPIYGYYETYLGHGIVGGSIVPFEEIGQKAAQLAIRILGGENPQAAARVESYRPVPMVDWRQLQRCHISEKSLPPSSIVRFKQTTYWEQHRQIIITAVSLCLVETILILALLAQLRRRRRAEATLRENEQRMSLAVDAANFGIWIRDLARNEIWASDKWRKLFGFAPSERLEFERILERMHADDRESVRHAFSVALAAGGTYDVEFRIMLPDGGMRWISPTARWKWTPMATQCGCAAPHAISRLANKPSKRRCDCAKRSLMWAASL